MPYAYAWDVGLPLFLYSCEPMQTVSALPLLYKAHHLFSNLLRRGALQTFAKSQFSRCFLPPYSPGQVPQLDHKVWLGPTHPDTGLDLASLPHL